MNDQEMKLFGVLTNELIHLRKMVYFQRAQIGAFGAFFAGEIAEATGKDAKQLCDTLEQGVRKLYDAQISEIEKYDAGFAARIDMRPDFDKDDQVKWYLPWEATGK